MFTRARIYNGASYLANHLTANDYYAEGEKVTGHWIGRGAELLGLAADVDAEQFEALAKLVKEIHSYECPEIVAVPLGEIAPAYRKWWEDAG